jgi:predicted O-methyltransferase YrrM
MNEGWHPGTVLATSSSFWRSCALHAAVRLDVFSTFRDQRLSAAELAQRLGTDERGLCALLDALTAMELLEKRDGLYATSRAARNLLCSDSSAYLGDIIRHHANLVTGWGRLDEAVRSGAPVRKRSSFDDDRARDSFLKGMLNLAKLVAPRLVPEIDLSGRRRLLDLGGGPGTYAIWFCRHNPDLRATVFDLPTSRTVAEETISSFEMTERVSFEGGDYLSDPLPGGFDVAWLSHILHAEGPESCARIISRAAAALEPGGLILVHEFLLNEAKDGPLFPALFALNMLIGTESGRAYSAAEISGMLTDAGIEEILRIPFDSPNDSGVIAGTRPG